MNNKRDLINIIASRAVAEDFFAFFNYLPNPDPVLKKMGRDITAYREILSDAHVGGCVRRRKAAVKNLNFRLTPTGKEEVDQWLEKVFNALPLNNIINEILDACLFGYQVLEIEWQLKEGKYSPKNIIGKPQEWFVFDKENQLKFRTKKERNGVHLPERKFLLATQEATYVNPYGKADLALCFWAATFKKGGFKFWLEFTEKYGAPWLVGKYPRQSQHKEIDELMTAMEQMLGTAVVAIPTDTDIDLKESASKGASSEVFKDFLEYCKAEIAIALLGQNQTTEKDTNHASAIAGLEVLNSIRADDARMVETVFNCLLNWICELNFTNLPQLPRFELYEQLAIDKDQAERDEMLSRIGVTFTPQYLERVYNFEKGDITVYREALSPQKMHYFSENRGKTPKDTAEQIIEQLEERTDPYIDGWLQQARDLLSGAESLEEAQNIIDSLIPSLETHQYAELLADSSVAAMLAGRYAVNEETKGKEKGK